MDCSVKTINDMWKIFKTENDLGELVELLARGCGVLRFCQSIVVLEGQPKEDKVALVGCEDILFQLAGWKMAEMLGIPEDSITKENTFFPLVQKMFEYHDWYDEIGRDADAWELIQADVDAATGIAYAIQERRLQDESEQ